MKPHELALVFVAAALLATAALAATHDPWIAVGVLAGLSGSIVILEVIAHVAKRLP